VLAAPAGLAALCCATAPPVKVIAAHIRPAVIGTRMAVKLFKIPLISNYPFQFADSGPSASGRDPSA
jgi:hypothetical protein